MPNEKGQPAVPAPGPLCDAYMKARARQSAAWEAQRASDTEALAANAEMTEASLALGALVPKKGDRRCYQMKDTYLCVENVNGSQVAISTMPVVKPEPV